MINLAKLKASIMTHEGLRTKPYSDTAGRITIGCGRDLSDTGISYTEAMFLLSNDIASCIDKAGDQPWWPTIENDDVRARATLEILFNLGLGGLNKFVHALTALQDGDFTEAAAQFRQSDWFNQVGNRAVILTGMIETGKDPS